MKYYEPKCCPVCQKSDVSWKKVRVGFLGPPLQLVFERDSTIWRICECGTYFQFPMPTQESLDEFYESDYALFWPRENGNSKRTMRIADIIKKHGGGSVLDVGCCVGRLLEIANKEGWEVCGVEPGEESRAKAKAYAPVYRNIDEVTRSYDWIVLSHTLEHVSEPLSMLSNCANLLAEGGRLLLLSPFPAFIGGTLTPSHTVLMSPAALEIAVDVVGLGVLEISESERETMMIAGQNA